MTPGRRVRGPRRPKVSSFNVLREAASRFGPAYRIDDQSASALRIRLRDSSGDRPDLILSHRHERRLFFRANYLVVKADVPGRGPPADGELRFRFRGPFSRQRASLRWQSQVADGDRWIARLQEPLLEAIDAVEAVESFRIRWLARRAVWSLELRTMSGAMVGGFMTAMPIAVPLDAAEVRGIVALVDALASTAA